MITKMPGIEHFYFNQTFIPGFLIFMIPVPIFSSYGFTTGGSGLAAPRSYSPKRQMKDGITGPRQPLPWNLT